MVNFPVENPALTKLTFSLSYYQPIMTGFAAFT